MTRPVFSVAACDLVRLACRMAGQPSHMPHGGSLNNLCHALGPAPPPDPQVSPFSCPRHTEGSSSNPSFGYLRPVLTSKMLGFR